jgi:hypothetical protein
VDEHPDARGRIIVRHALHQRGLVSPEVGLRHAASSGGGRRDQELQRLAKVEGWVEQQLQRSRQSLGIALASERCENLSASSSVGLGLHGPRERGGETIVGVDGEAENRAADGLG